MAYTGTNFLQIYSCLFYSKWFFFLKVLKFIFPCLVALTEKFFQSFLVSIKHCCMILPPYFTNMLFLAGVYQAMQCTGRRRGCALLRCLLGLCCMRCNFNAAKRISVGDTFSIATGYVVKLVIGIWYMHTGVVK